MTQATPMIELRRVHRFFGRTKAVNDVTFEVKAGQVFGFIGPNGAGKTTCMRILATLELPTYGDAFVDGLSVVNDPDLVRKRLGFMPDGFATYPNMNCVEYLDFFARASGLVGAKRSESLHRTLEFTGLDKIASKSIRGLSKGMRQRLCLGRAMIHDPAVLILDEPANGLDPRARIELRQLITKLAAEGKAVLISSHILTELAEMCDQIGIIERGALLTVGEVSDIEKQLEAKFEMQIQLIDRIDECANWLEQHPKVNNLRKVYGGVVFDFLGEATERAELLADLIQNEYPVVQFSGTKQSLEEIFMKITTGAVQ